MLDCVFNHAGERFPMFEDVKKNGENSKFKDWFYIRKFPLSTDPLSYETFSFVGSMPKFNTSNPETLSYLINVATYWIREFDIDGWRLDVANEVEFKFWRQFCSAVRAVKADVFILGEVWNNSLNWINSDKFDSAMNYPLFYCITNCIANQGSITTFQQTIDHIRHWYPETANHVLFNILSSHDAPRLLFRCKEDATTASMAYAFLLTYPGSPCIYYGDEIGISGDQDPECRRCMEWDNSRYNLFLYDTIQKLIQIRKENPVIRNGNFRWLEISEEDKSFIFKRENDKEKILVLFRLDSSQHPVELNLKHIEGHIATDVGLDLFNGKYLNLKKVSLPSRTFRIIKVEK